MLQKGISISYGPAPELRSFISDMIFIICADIERIWPIIRLMQKV